LNIHQAKALKLINKMNSPISDITTSPRMSDYSSIANISLYIPRVFKNIGGKRIEDIFHSLRIGKVRAVNFRPKVGKHGHYNSVSIHFDYWYDNVAARNFQQRVIEGKEAIIVYDDPWFWTVLEFKPVAQNASPSYQGCKNTVQLEDRIRKLEKEVQTLEDELVLAYNSG
jgi:hypothetical protein